MFCAGKRLHSLLPQLKDAIVRALHRGTENFRDLHWMTLVDDVHKIARAVVSCEEEFHDATSEMPRAAFERGDGVEAASTERRDQLLALRGLLGHGVLEHCLEKRYRVDYGTAERWGAPSRCTLPDSPNKGVSKRGNMPSCKNKVDLASLSVG